MFSGSTAPQAPLAVIMHQSLQIVRGLLNNLSAPLDKQRIYNIIKMNRSYCVPWRGFSKLTSFMRLPHVVDNVRVKQDPRNYVLDLIDQKTETLSAPMNLGIDLTFAFINTLRSRFYYIGVKEAIQGHPSDCVW